MITDLKNAREAIERAELHRLLDQLLDLRDRSDPKTCSDPASLEIFSPPQDSLPIGGTEEAVLEVARGKDIGSTWAAMMAIRLAISAGGWAINHMAGKAINGSGTAPNAHEHELLGAAEADSPNHLLNPYVARSCLRSLLSPLGLGLALPNSLANELTNSLAALEFGEVMPLLEPVRSGKHGRAYSLFQAKCDLVRLIHFRYGQGVPVSKSYAAIADAVHKDAKAIQNWDLRDIPRDMGQEDAQRMKSEARLAGEYYFNSDIDPGWKGGKTTDGIVEILMVIYAGWTVAELAARYLEAEAPD